MFTLEGRLLISSQSGQSATEEIISLPGPIKLFLDRVNLILDPEKPYMKHIEEILFRIKSILTTADKNGFLTAIGSRGFSHNIESIAQNVTDFTGGLTGTSNNVNSLVKAINTFVTNADNYMGQFSGGINKITSNISDMTDKQMREVMNKIVNVMTTIEVSTRDVIGNRLPRVIEGIERVLSRLEGVLINIERSPLFGGTGRRGAREGTRPRRSGQEESELIE